MKISIKPIIVMLSMLLNCQLVFSAEVIAPITYQRDNETLLQIQTLDRDETISTTISWDEHLRNGVKRRAETLQLLKENQFKTAYDYWRAAMIFQHGVTADDFRMAHSLAWIAFTLHPDEETRWLTAATWDRLLNSLGKPQWYGTQSIPSQDGKFWLLVDIDEEAISDEERLKFTNKKIQNLTFAKPRNAKPGQPNTLPDGYYTKHYQIKQKPEE